MNELEIAALLLGLLLASLVGAIVNERWRALLIAATVVCASLTIFWIHMTFAGAVVLYDPGGRVARAEIVSGSGPTVSRMTRLPGGLFYGEPEGDGAARLQCADGRTVGVSYVTPGMPVFETLVPPLSC